LATPDLGLAAMPPKAKKKEKTMSVVPDEEM
jgi:hypothetical protein